jgi:hypothetical protein
MVSWKNNGFLPLDNYVIRNDRKFLSDYVVNVDNFEETLHLSHDVTSSE